MKLDATKMVWSLALTLAVGCGSSSTTSDDDAKQRESLTTGMHTALLGDLDVLVQASTDLQTAAPTPTGRGWEAQDAAAVADMKAAWLRGRTAYEHIEGAIAPLFPDIDVSIDARYEAALENLGGKGDSDPFDGEGLTGMHALERILYADVVPPHVVELESKLPGYAPAAAPKTEQEAAEFKTKLCERMIADAKRLRDQWTPAHIDLDGAFGGLVSLMNEQREKVNKASTNEEESRYSQRTMADIRDNLVGTVAIYKLFQPWLAKKPGGADIDARIQAGFTSLDATYREVQGDTIPRPPETWSSLHPTDVDLGTPFGKLFSAVDTAVDPERDGSIVHEMNAAAAALGLKQP